MTDEELRQRGFAAMRWHKNQCRSYFWLGWLSGVVGAVLSRVVWTWIGGAQ